MNVQKLVGAVAATILTFGIGAATVPSASAADNIKTYGEEETLNGPNGEPYIGYTVYNLKPSNDPVAHNGKLYSAKLKVTGGIPIITGFGARAESGDYYPAIFGASNPNKLYFDVVGPVPNSVVWNDGIRDILVWISGETPLDPDSVSAEPAEVAAPAAPAAPAPASAPAEGMPAESDPALTAVPNDLARPPFELTEGEVSMPGFNR